MTTDGQIKCILNRFAQSHCKVNAKEYTNIRIYLGATPSKIDLLSVTDDWGTYAAAQVETEPNTLQKQEKNKVTSNSTSALQQFDNAIQDEIADSLNLVTEV